MRGGRIRNAYLYELLQEMSSVRLLAGQRRFIPYTCTYMYMYMYRSCVIQMIRIYVHTYVQSVHVACKVRTHAVLLNSHLRMCNATHLYMCMYVHVCSTASEHTDTLGT